MSKISFFYEFWDFFKVRKKWWLAPIIILLVTEKPNFPQIEEDILTFWDKIDAFKS